ncbi:MAG: type 4 fimbrial assembly protein PilC [Pseudomonadota bacterium]|jgi:type IV pilus assembly protein PilC
MADFEYQGVDRSGKRVSGTLAAQSDGELRVMLRAQGVRPTKISKKAGAGGGLLSGSRSSEKKGSAGGSTSLNLKQRILLTRQLQVMISSGIPLMQSLDILADQSADPAIRGMLAELRDRVSQGSFFWEALAGYPRSFSKIYVALVRAGEASGSLDIVLKRLTRYLEDSERLRKMLVGALTYPAIVSLVGLGVLVLMLVFVIPKFEEMLKSNNAELPLPTQIVIGASHFVGDHFLILGGAAAGLAFGVIRFVQTPEGKAVFDRTLLALPLFGSVVQKGAIAGFSRTMQTLLNAGVNLIDAVDIARDTIDNVVVAQAVGTIRGEVEMGKSLSTVLSGLTVFPKMASQMISVGEATGNLDKMLEKVADFYEAEVESAVGTVGKMIEPLILVVLGGAVAGMLIAMYLPMFKMAGSGGPQ